MTIESIGKMPTKELKSNIMNIVAESKKLDKSSQDALLLSVGDKLTEEDKTELYKQKNIPLDDRIFASKSVKDLEQAVLKLKEKAKEKAEITTATMSVNLVSSNIDMAGTSG